MTVQQLITLLESCEDKNVEVVYRTGYNHGANIVSKTSYWVAIPNENPTNSINPADVLLPDSDYSGDSVLVLS